MTIDNISQQIKLLDAFLINTMGASVKNDKYSLGKFSKILEAQSDINKILNREIATKSGIYIFSSSQSEVLYIGKAGSNNLAAEIWGKFQNRKIPFNHIWKNDLKVSTCTKSSMAEGNFILTIFVINPEKYVSLYEVFLQTCCSNNLPELNKKIG